MAFFIAISFISCKKILVEENLVDKKLIKEVRTLASVVGSKTAFAILSPAEKFALIQEQLSYVIDEIPLTLSQKISSGNKK